MEDNKYYTTPFPPPITGTDGDSARSSDSESPALDPFGFDPIMLIDPANLPKRPTTAFRTEEERPFIFPPREITHTPTPRSQVGGRSLRPAGIIDASDPSSKAPFVRGHRRRSTHVTHRDLEKFRQEVLGIEKTENPYWYEEGGTSPAATPNPSADPQLEDLNRAFASASMSLNTGGMSGSSPGQGMFSSYDNSANPNMPRQMSPAMPHTPSQVNGGGMAGMNGGMPMNAGHQMDLHHVYEMVLELSEVLKNNRETTNSIVNSAEEIMKRAASEGASPSLQQVNGEISAARIAELERALAKEKRTVEILKNEQVENTKLIGEYEQAVGTMVEQIRNYCQNNNMNYLAQKRQYNNLLQAERDAHLESRLDRDYWHAQTMKCAEMIRTAYRLRCEEEDIPLRVVSGLQNEVRAYRFALGMEPEKPEEEYGWEILKDAPPSID